MNSLVGVAISASLLPPAVNTGLCLAMALVGPTVVSFNVDVRAKTFDGVVKCIKGCGLTGTNIILDICILKSSQYIGTLKLVYRFYASYSMEIKAYTNINIFLMYSF